MACDFSTVAMFLIKSKCSSLQLNVPSFLKYAEKWKNYPGKLAKVHLQRCPIPPFIKIPYTESVLQTGTSGLAKNGGGCFYFSIKDLIVAPMRCCSPSHGADL